MTSPPIFHLALAPEWADAGARGVYEHSTRGLALADVGFIHCSFAHQVRGVADAFYRHADVVLLHIDPTVLDADVVVENLEGGDEGFPHVYGPIPTQAVIDVAPVPLAPDGRLDLTGLLPE